MWLDFVCFPSFKVKLRFKFPSVWYHSVDNGKMLSQIFCWCVSVKENVAQAVNLSFLWKKKIKIFVTMVCFSYIFVQFLRQTVILQNPPFCDIHVWTCTQEQSLISFITVLFRKTWSSNQGKEAISCEKQLCSMNKD